MKLRILGFVVILVSLGLGLQLQIIVVDHKSQDHDFADIGRPMVYAFATWEWGT